MEHWRPAPISPHLLESPLMPPETCTSPTQETDACEKCRPAALFLRTREEAVRSSRHPTRFKQPSRSSTDRIVSRSILPAISISPTPQIRHRASFIRFQPAETYRSSRVVPTT